MRRDKYTDGTTDMWTSIDRFKSYMLPENPVI